MIARKSESLNTTSVPFRDNTFLIVSYLCAHVVQEDLLHAFGDRAYFLIMLNVFQPEL